MYDKNGLRRVYNNTKRTESVNEWDRRQRNANIIGIIFIILFILAFFRILVGQVPLTFTGFLQTLETVPSVDVTSALIDLSIAGDWGIFDFLRIFINSLSSILEIGVFFSANILNLLLLLIWILKFFFLPI